MHDESSSSQNDNITVTELSYKGAGKRTVYLSFSDGSFFYIPQSFISKYNLYEGIQLSCTDYQALYFSSQTKLGYIKAVELLGPRAHSCREMQIKLQKRDFSTEVITSVVEKLKEKGYLDDSKFAISWIRSRIKKHPEGPYQLLAGLLKKGISHGIASRVIAEFIEEYGLERLRTEAETYLKKRRCSDIVMRLRKQGFSYNY